MQAGRKLALHQTSMPGAQQGFTYIALLVAMLVLALSTQGVMTYASQQAQRERESALLRVGQAYAHAIGAYYEATPGSAKSWPRSLDDLIEDRRFVTLRRHLRDMYADPITRSVDWGLVSAPDGGIMGVFSKNEALPIRTAAIDLDGLRLSPAGQYSDWRFVYQPAGAVTSGQPTGTPAGRKP